MACNVVLWAAILIFIDVSSVSLLLMGNICIAAAFGSTKVATVAAVRSRIFASPATRRSSFRRAWLVELFALIACAILLSMIAFYFSLFGHTEFFALMFVQAIGVPARFIGPVRARMPHPKYYRIYRSLFGAILMVILLALSPAANMAAMGLALREWLTLLIIMTKCSDRKELGVRSLELDIVEEAPRWSEFARHTAALNVQRFHHRINMLLLHSFLGPLGTIFARVGRGLKIFPAISKKTNLLYFTLICACFSSFASLLILIFGSGFELLIFSVLLLRVTLVALSTLAWRFLVKRLGAEW